MPRNQTLEELRRENEALRLERDAALARAAERADAHAERVAQQAVTIDVLRAMAASPEDAQPIFAMIAEQAQRFCDADAGSLMLLADGMLHLAAHAGFSAEGGRRYEAEFPRPVDPDTVGGRAILTGETSQISDIARVDGYAMQSLAQSVGIRSNMAVPLRRGGAIIGAITIGRHRPGTFSDAQMALLETFAEQAVIAIASAETFRALQDRTAALARRNTEYAEQTAHQAASIDILGAIAKSSGDAAPVLRTIVEHAVRLCGCPIGRLWEYRDGLLLEPVDVGFDPDAVARVGLQYPRRLSRDFMPDCAILDRRPNYVRDSEMMTTRPPNGGSWAWRSGVAVPLLRDGEPIGILSIASDRKDAISPGQIALLENFANQAVIAVENARLLREQREALERQTATAEVLEVINASPGDLTPVFESIVEKAHILCGATCGGLMTYDGASFHLAAERNLPAAWAAFVREIMLARLNPNHPLSRIVSGEPLFQITDMREVAALFPDEPWPRAMLDLGGIRSILYVPLRKEGTLLGVMTAYRQEVRPFSEKEIALLENFAAQAVIAMENARLLNEIRMARDNAEATLRELQIAQANLVQAEKMASLGQLTAGIAHEIKNPLNFVNNFAALSVELLDELKETAAPGFAALTESQRADIDDVSQMLTANLRKIEEHGKRADGIVKAMLEHSRGSSGERREVDLNGLVEEALNLAYHGARAQDQSFNIALEREYAQGIAPIEVNPQDLTRVFLNMFSNGFYATNKRAKQDAEPGFNPTLRVSTIDRAGSVEIRIRDNGIGVPHDIRDKLFEPFFTTKPTGEGTGLGLSITYDIVTKQHGGTIAVDSAVGAYTEFVVTLPRRMFAGEGTRP